MSQKLIFLLIPFLFFKLFTLHIKQPRRWIVIRRIL